MKLLSCSLILFYISITCCNSNNQTDQTQKENDQWLKFASQTVEYWKGRKMYLPDTLPLLNFDSSAEKDNAKLKMVTYVDGTCSMCVDNLKHWTEFMNAVNKGGQKCQFIFYIKADDKDEFQKNAINKTGFKSPWFFDKNDDFIRANKLYDLRFQTALLDSTDHVILIGTMAERPPLEALYKETITRASN